MIERKGETGIAVAVEKPTTGLKKEITMIRIRCRCPIWIVALTLLFSVSVAAADEGGWRPLFDGKNLDNWQSADGGAPSAGWVVEDGAVVRKDRASYIWTKDRFDDFVLDMEFKTQGNSGIFIRTDNAKNPVQTGIEVQVITPSAAPSKHSTGALYDLKAPSKVADKPAGEWNRIVIMAKDGQITIELNGEQIIDANLDEWTVAQQNPDGSKNKFKTALKDFKRDGHIGLQDHGAPVAYRNIRIRPVR